MKPYICRDCGYEFVDEDKVYEYREQLYCPDCMYDKILEMPPAELIALTEAKAFVFGEV